MSHSISVATSADGHNHWQVSEGLAPSSPEGLRLGAAAVQYRVWDP